jgi:hypothetical protein
MTYASCILALLPMEREISQIRKRQKINLKNHQFPPIFASSDRRILFRWSQSWSNVMKLIFLVENTLGGSKLI